MKELSEELKEQVRFLEELAERLERESNEAIEKKDNLLIESFKYLEGTCIKKSGREFERITRVYDVEFKEREGKFKIRYECIRAFGMVYTDGFRYEVVTSIYSGITSNELKTMVISREEFNKEYMKVINKLIEINK